MQFDLKTEIQKATDYLQKCKEKKVNISIIRSQRSLNQNNYFHGIICAIFGLEFGYTIEESKQIFRQEFLSYEKKDKIFFKSTTELNTKEFEDLCSKCRMKASKEGCFIPLPNEITSDIFNFIENYSKYL